MAIAHRRLPFMALAGLSLLAALWGGLIRLGWPLPLVPTLPPNHGPLLVTGFLGTLIGLERAVALKRRWPYGAPLLSGLGGLALLAGLNVHLGRGLMAAGGAFLIAVSVISLNTTRLVFASGNLRVRGPTSSLSRRLRMRILAKVPRMSTSWLPRREP